MLQNEHEGSITFSHNFDLYSYIEKLKLDEDGKTEGKGPMEHLIYNHMERRREGLKHLGNQ